MDADTPKLDIKTKLINKIISLNDGSEPNFQSNYLSGLSVDRLKHILLVSKTMRIDRKNH